jgi:hypothetical protein
MKDRRRAITWIGHTQNRTTPSRPLWRRTEPIGASQTETVARRYDLGFVRYKTSITISLCPGADCPTGRRAFPRTNEPPVQAALTALGFKI